MSYRAKTLGPTVSNNLRCILPTRVSISSNFLFCLYNLEFHQLSSLSLTSPLLFSCPFPHLPFSLIFPHFPSFSPITLSTLYLYSPPLIPQIPTSPHFPFAPHWSLLLRFLLALATPQLPAPMYCCVAGKNRYTARPSQWPLCLSPYTKDCFFRLRRIILMTVLAGYSHIEFPSGSSIFRNPLFLSISRGLLLLPSPHSSSLCLYIAQFSTHILAW